MATYFNRGSKDFSQSLGEGLGQGIGSGFQALANMKMQDYAARQAQTRQNEQAQKVSDMMKQQYGEKYAQIPFMSPQMQGPAFKALQDMESGKNLESVYERMGLIEPRKHPTQGEPTQPGQEATSNIPVSPAERSVAPMGPVSAKDLTKALDLKSKSEKIKAHQEDLKLTHAERDRAQTEREQIPVKKYMGGLHKDFKLNEQINTKAKNLLKMAEHAKNKYPGWFKGPLNYLTQNMFERDPEIRKLGDQLNELVPLLSSQKMGGRPSVYALTQEQLSKANISQPYETVIGILNDVVRSSELGMQPYRYGKSKKNKDNTYPTDIEDIVGNFDMFVQNPFSVSPAGIIKPGKKVTFNGVTKVATADGWEDAK